MVVGAHVLDAGRLRVCRLLRRRARVEFRRVRDTLGHLGFVERTIDGRDVSIYIHIPFCRYICTFCPYFRDVLRGEHELKAYFNALLREIEIYGKLFEGRSLRVVEVHVGGGTPSLVPPELYKELVERLAQFFDVRCGVGIEANPEDLSRYEYVESLHAAGVDEVSIGVQSFDERVLKSIGRRHSPRDSVKAVENCLKAGLKWVNVGLMFLTPSIKGYAELSVEEKLKIFREDLAKSYELGAHQITFYATVVPRGSPGYKLVERGVVYQELDYVDAFVDEAVGFAEDRGLHLVRVYSASRKRYEYATVNLEMVGPLLGFGAGSWSNTGLYQYVNVHSVHDYVDSLSKGLPPAMYSRSISPALRVWRLFFDQLSAVEISENVFKRFARRGMPLGVKLLLKIMELRGLVKRVGSSYRLTRLGIREVYKAVMNYVVEIPVKATEVFLKIAESENHLEVVRIA